MTNTCPSLASWGMDGEPTHAIVPCGHQVRGVSRGLSVGSQIPIALGVMVGPPSGPSEGWLFRGLPLDSHENGWLGGGLKHVLFSPLPGEDSHFDYTIFFRWVETTNQMSMEPVQKPSIAFAKIHLECHLSQAPPSFNNFLEASWQLDCSFMFGHKHFNITGRCSPELVLPKQKRNHYRWWFQICFIFTPIWGRCPILTM